MDHLVWLEIAEEPIANNGLSTFLHFSNPISLVLYLYRPDIALGILVCSWVVAPDTGLHSWRGRGLRVALRPGLMVL